ncbi:MAG: hypothetical protein HC876_20995, partial [Chloroflexaceae bacterium]|nr:hypothetical protein [Chloroflexaceae bacterium]
MTITHQQTLSETISPTLSIRQRPLRIIGIIALSLGLILAIVVIGAYTYSAAILNPVTSTPITASPNRFDGRYLLTVSDADMVGTAYANDILMQIPGERDTLSIFPLPLDVNDPQINEVFASNSVTSWPQVLIPSPDGERAYIVEAAGEIDDNLEVYPNVQASPPLGRTLTVVELATGTTTVYDVVDYPLHVAVHPEEQYVAIGTKEANRQLVILPVETLDDAGTYQFFPIENSDGEPAEEVTSVSWHPNGNYLAVGIDRSELAFYEVIPQADGTLNLQQYGERLMLGNTITYGQFTNDGRHYLTAEINWAALPGQLGYVFNPRGEMIAVQFDLMEGNHGVVSRVEVGQSPEGFAISPDESLIVTIDMRRTYLPDNLSFIPGTDLNSLSLLTFNNSTGELVLIDQYGFEGVLPEHAVFDADGDALGVVIY